MKSNISSVLVLVALLGLGSCLSEEPEAPQTRGSIEVTVVSAKVPSAEQLVCTVCLGDVPKSFSKAHINEAADCDDFFTTGEPVTTTNGTVTFDRHFGPSKSDNYSNLTSFAVFQLFAGEPAEETLILTGTVLVKDVLEKDKNGKEGTFEQIVPPKPRAVLNCKVQFNAAFGCLLASPALMVVTLLVVALWSHQ